MKTLFTIIFLSAICSISAQEHCTYNSAIGYNFGANTVDEVFDMAIQPDGKIILLGFSRANANTPNPIYRIGMLRLHADGTKDMDFGVGGHVAQVWGVRTTGNCVALQSDGKILVGGDQVDSGFNNFNSYVARFLPNGELDTDFADEGLKLLTGVYSATSGTRSVVQRNDGKIQATASGISPTGYSVWRLNEDGTSDTTYASGGHAVFTSSLVQYSGEDESGLAFSDGAALVIGKNYNGGVDTRLLVVKFNPEGELDTLFGVGGVVNPEILIGATFFKVDAILTEAEDILISTSISLNPRRFILFKFDGVTGELDIDFGTGGIVESSQNGTDYDSNALAIDPLTQDIVVVGRGGDPGNPAVWRVNQNGEEVNQCDGEAVHAPDLPFSSYKAVAFASDGKLLLAGHGTVADPADEVETDQESFNFVRPIFEDPSSVTEASRIDFSVYPNPASAELKLQSSVQGTMQFRILDMLGRQVSNAVPDQGSSNTINVSDLPCGLYTIELITEDGRSGRLVFMKE